MSETMNKSPLRIFSWIINIAVMGVIFTALYYSVYYASVFLLEDKKPVSTITEGKYIITSLAEEYDDILKEKGKNLDVERLKLLSQIELSKSYKERMQIEAQLKKIEAQKRDFNSELSNNERQTIEIENTLRNTKAAMADLIQKNFELTSRLQSIETSSNDYETMTNRYEAMLRDAKTERDKRINALILENERLAGLLNAAGNSVKTGSEGFFAYRTDTVYNDPVIDKGKMFATIKNQLIIFSKDGKALKTVALAGVNNNLTRPAFSDGIIYSGSDGGGITACDETGKVLWKGKAGTETFGASPSGAYGIVAVPSIDDGIYIYNKNGRLITKVDSSVPIYSAPLITDLGRKLIYATENGDISAYDINKNTEIWKKNYSENYTERILHPIVGDDKITVLFSSTGTMRALNTADGTLIWKTDFPEIKDTVINPRFINGKILLANNDGTSVVIIVDSQNGHIEAKSSLINEKIIAPYESGGTIYFGTTSGNTYSYILQQ